MPSFSVLDLSPILTGGDAAQALANSLDLARHAERWGYARYWLAEHHNMPGIASAATAVVIGHVAGGTRTIRVGAGGIMLPNHAPLVVAEQFGTLESLYPGRIDLGLGRAPGTDRRTMHALRRDLGNRSDTFQEDVVELISYFGPPARSQKVSAIPGAGLHVPVWILGSSLFGARVAAELGLPYAFASHFAPPDLDEAIALYRREFRPSVTHASLREPHLMLGLNIVAADSDREAKHLATSLHQAFVALRRGMPTALRPPIDTMEGLWTEMERAQLEAMLACSIVGSPVTVRRGLEAFVARTDPDELIVTSQVFDHGARLRSFEIVAEVAREGLAAAG
ncbi:MAG TPA: LLM class flavin-dependent oxidoreductase [Polyangiaceae bacterium]|jgi:luciferase family oxidoreductase group 1|nr:LLM class flavin-dependent oxidoreductase [Polyangiaceae bacterium]